MHSWWSHIQKFIESRKLIIRYSQAINRGNEAGNEISCSKIEQYNHKKEQLRWSMESKQLIRLF